jgi:hypothetical protein
MLRSKRDHSDFLNYFIAIMNNIVNFITIIIILLLLLLLLLLILKICRVII